MRVPVEDHCQFRQFPLAVHRTRRIRRRVEDHPFRRGSDGGSELLRGEQEPVGFRAVDDDGCSAVDGHHVGVRHPVRRGHDHLGALLHRRHQRQEDDLLGTTADGDLVVRELDPGPVEHPLRDRVPQCGNTVDGGVLGETGFHRCDGCRLDVVRRVEIGLSDRQVEDLPPRRPELANPLRSCHTR